MITAMIVTAYSDINGSHPIGITASMTETRRGIVACGESFDYGTLFYIMGKGLYVCQDRGGAITDDRLDIWMLTEEEALEWGRQELPVIVIQPWKIRRGLKGVIRKYFPYAGKGGAVDANTK